MARAGLADAGFFQLFGHPVSQIGRAEAAAVSGKEHGGFRWQKVKQRAGLGQVTVQPPRGTLADGEQAAVAVFTLAHEQGEGGGIEVALVELGHFAAADAGGVEEFEDGAVAQAEGIVGVRKGEQTVDFLRREGFGKAASLLARQVEIGCRVGGNHSGAAKPGEEAPHASEPGEMGVDHQCLLGARAAVVVEKKLIFLKGGTGETGGGNQSARPGPFDKLP